MTAHVVSSAAARDEGWHLVLLRCSLSPSRAQKPAPSSCAHALLASLWPTHLDLCLYRFSASPGPTWHPTLKVSFTPSTLKFIYLLKFSPTCLHRPRTIVDRVEQSIRSRILTCTSGPTPSVGCSSWLTNDEQSDASGHELRGYHAYHHREFP